MPPPNGLEANMFSSCPSVSPSVSDVFSPAITTEPLTRMIWNYSIILSTSKWKAELFFLGRVIQDGCLSATFIRNLYGSITLYWNKILISIFYYIPDVTPKQMKVLKIAKNYRKLTEIADNGQKHLYWSISLYWIEILISIFYYIPEVTPKLKKEQKITGNCW